VTTPAKPGWPTGLSQALNCEDWPVFPDVRPADPERGEPEGVAMFTRFGRYRTGQQFPLARLRRIGWLDQKGRVYTAMPPQAGFDGGSLTPLLIDPGERDGL
jgi:hypothetical protein